jgi:uncharacterized cupin superfamily protein
MAKSPAVIDTNTVEKRRSSGYPEVHKKEVMGCARARLGDLFDLTQFGVNMVTLEPGSWSSHRHWHDKEDEFIYVVEGEVTLVDNTGPHLLKRGMCAGFKAGNGNGHHLQNNSKAPCTYLEVGTRAPSDVVMYSDIDMKAVSAEGGGWRFVKKDGSAFSPA